MIIKEWVIIPGVIHKRTTVVKNEEELKKELKKYEIKFSDKIVKKLKETDSNQNNQL